MAVLDVGLVVGGLGAAAAAGSVLPGQQAGLLRLAGIGVALVGGIRLAKSLRERGGLAAAAGEFVLAPDATEVGATRQVPAPPLQLPSLADREPAAVPAGSPSSGVAAGGALYKVTAELISPRKGGSVSRALFKTTYPVRVELLNHTDVLQRVSVTALVTYHRLGGAEERLEDLGSHEVNPLGVARFDAQLGSGNYHTGLFEFGAANVALALFVDGRQVHSTSFELR